MTITPAKLSVTFTGADNRTLIDDLADIIDASVKLAVPIEFGLLCSTSRAGDERYPSGHAAQHLLRVCRGENVPVAVHLCGAAARAVLSNRCFEPDAFGTQQWRDVVIEIASTGRVQVNLPRGMSTTENLRAAWRNLQKLVARAGWPNMGTVIGQHRDDVWPEPGLDEAPFTEGGDIAWLLDRSGGRGIPLRVSDMPRLPGHPVGVAGGLGPDDNTQAVARHMLASTHGGWLDMESKIRHGGKLDADLCVEVLRRVALARDEVA